MHTHQVNVSVLLPLELLSTHVTRPVHVQLHVSVKLKDFFYSFCGSSVKCDWSLDSGYLILFCKGLVTSLLGALVVGAVLASQVPPTGAIITMIIIITIVKLIMLMLTMMM